VKKTSLCIIPARGGSKGIPNKNIVDVLGKPLISYSIVSAIESNLFDRVIVTTDSEDIANISLFYGAEVPFIRPEELSTDASLVQDAIVHCLKYVEEEYGKYEYVCLRQATSPLISKEDIIESSTLLIDKKADIIVSVTETPYNINWTGKIGEDLSMKNFMSFCGTRRQDFSTTYVVNGGIYFGKWDIFYDKKNYYEQDVYAYKISYEKSIDIDSELDLDLVKYFIGKAII